MANALKQPSAPVADTIAGAAEAPIGRDMEFAETVFHDLLTSLAPSTAPAVFDEIVESSDVEDLTAVIVQPDAMPLPNAHLNQRVASCVSSNTTTFDRSVSAFAAIDECGASGESPEVVIETDTDLPSSASAAPIHEAERHTAARHGTPAAALQHIRILLGEPLSPAATQVGSTDDMRAPMPGAKPGGGFDSQRQDEGASMPAMQAAPPAPGTDELLTPFEEPGLPRIAQTIGSNAWRQELTQRINLMIDKGEQILTLRLTPEHLGPLEIRVAVREGDTSLWFGAPHHETRQALEQTLPKLREQFAQAGLTLGQSWISNGSPQESAQQHSRATTVDAARERPLNKSDPGRATIGTTLGLIDTYV